MNQERLKSTAITLDSLLEQYAPVDKEAAILKSTVGDIVRWRYSAALAFRDVPGDRFILESHLMQNHRDLTDAFMLFKLAITEKKPEAAVLEGRPGGKQWPCGLRGVLCRRRKTGLSHLV